MHQVRASNNASEKITVQWQWPENVHTHSKVGHTLHFNKYNLQSAYMCDYMCACLGYVQKRVSIILQPIKY